LIVQQRLPTLLSNSMQIKLKPLSMEEQVDDTQES